MSQCPSFDTYLDMNVGGKDAREIFPGRYRHHGTQRGQPVAIDTLPDRRGLCGNRLKSTGRSECVVNGNSASQLHVSHEVKLKGPVQDCLGSDLYDGLNALLKAYRYAIDTHRTVWDFAVETERLRTYRMSECDFRWLIGKGYVEHQEDITLLGQHNRCFRPLDGLMFARSSCLVLTLAGVEFAQNLCAAPSGKQCARAIAGASGPMHHTGNGETIPTWDADRFELSWNGKLVKRFKVPSPNQHRILTAFHENGWSHRIDDPLSRVPKLDPRRRLHEAIKSLNRNQKERLLRFTGDGTGAGVCWEPVNPKS